MPDYILQFALTVAYLVFVGLVGGAIALVLFHLGKSLWPF